MRADRRGACVAQRPQRADRGAAHERALARGSHCDALQHAGQLAAIEVERAVAAVERFQQPLYAGDDGAGGGGAATDLPERLQKPEAAQKAATSSAPTSPRPAVPSVSS